MWFRSQPLGSTWTVSAISDRRPPPSTWSPAPGSGHTWCGTSLAAVLSWDVEDNSPAAWCLAAAVSPCRRSWAVLVSSFPSLLVAAVSFTDTLVSCVPMLSAVSLGQGALVSRPLAAWGASSGSEALVSRSLVLPAASMFLRLHSCFPSPCTAASLSRWLSHSYPWTLYLDLTARSWSRTLRGWQARLPWSGLVISQAPKRLTPAFCSSTPILLPQECCERKSFLPACAPAGLQWGNSELTLSVLRLQCGCLFTLVRPTQAVGWPGR